MYRRLPVALVAACLTVGMVAAPSAVAAEGSKAKAAKVSKKSEARQAGTSTPSPRVINRRLNTTRRQVATARKTLSKLGRDLGAMSTRLKSSEGGVALLLGAAPQLVTGLQTLAGVVQNQIAPGLLQLKSVLETQVAPGLKALETAAKVTIPNAIRDVATSQEYGVTGLFVGGQRATTFTSSDIPDDGNSAAAGGQAPVITSRTIDHDADPGTPEIQPPGTSPANIPAAIRAAIRSGESDGGATGDPAGYVGGLLVVKCAGNPLAASDADNNCDPDAGGAAPEVGPGSIVCTVGPPSNINIANPAGGTIAAPVRMIQEKAARTDQSKPAIGDLNPLANAPATGAGTSSSGSCNLGHGIWSVEVQTQYVDIPTSTAPGATE
jgi:hypothetical protein